MSAYDAIKMDQINILKWHYSCQINFLRIIKFENIFLENLIDITSYTSYTPSLTKTFSQIDATCLNITQEWIISTTYC